jgi:hypothetical protein
MRYAEIGRYLRRALLGAILFSVSAVHMAHADVGMGLRAGTLGFGADVDIGMNDKLSLRFAYNFLDYDRTIEDTDVTYDGKLKISSFSGFLDWHVFGGGFRLSLGAVGSGPKFEVDGTPAPGEAVEINGTLYDRTELGSLNGEIKIGNSVAPYIGLGYGNVVSEKHRITFLFDVGAIYGGTPEVNLSATCGPAISANPAACAQLQRDVQVEINELKNDASAVEWYPVISLGIGIRF